MVDIDPINVKPGKGIRAKQGQPTEQTLVWVFLCTVTWVQSKFDFHRSASPVTVLEFFFFFNKSLNKSLTYLNGRIILYQVKDLNIDPEEGWAPSKVKIKRNKVKIEIKTPFNTYIYI